MLDVKGILVFLFGDGGMHNTLVWTPFVCYWVYKFFWIFMNKKMKKNQSESSKVANPLLKVDFLMLGLSMFKGLSLYLRILSPSSLPLLIASNFLSEIPMLLLFLLICTGWPLVMKKPLLQLRKGNVLLLIGIFFMELCLTPYFNMVVFPHDIYNPTHYFESLNIFKFALLFQAYKSSKVCLKEQVGVATASSQAPINVYVYTTQLFRSMLFYYPSYLVLRTILSYFFFYLFFSAGLHELLSLVFFVVTASKFFPLHNVVDDESFFNLLKDHSLLFKSSSS